MYYNGNSVAVPAPADAPAISVYNNISFDCKNVDLYYGSFQALKGINLRIEKNQITALIGPSGCGKSTFLRSLNRMNDLIPSCRVEGEILLAGVDAYKDIDPIVLRRHVGMVFQQPNPFPKSVYDNVAYGPRLKGITKKADLDEIVESSLRQAAIWDELKDRLHKSALGLSGGQQQRVAAARAMVTNPAIVLADEPTGALDSNSSRMLLTMLTELNERLSATILMVTHDAFSASYCNRILFIKDGQVFNELHRGTDTRKEFFTKILEVVSVLGGEQSEHM